MTYGTWPADEQSDYYIPHANFVCGVIKQIIKSQETTMLISWLGLINQPKHIIFRALPV